jgi:hypothetical protein
MKGNSAEKALEMSAGVGNCVICHRYDFGRLGKCSVSSACDHVIT